MARGMVKLLKILVFAVGIITIIDQIAFFLFGFFDVKNRVKTIFSAEELGFDPDTDNPKFYQKGFDFGEILFGSIDESKEMEGKV